MTRFFGAIQSPPDPRDYPLAAFVVGKEPLPKDFELPVAPPVYNQGQTSMCLDFACRFMKETQEWIERGEFEPLASGYVYGNRQPGHYMGEGMITREALEVLLKFGIPPASAFSVVGSFLRCRAEYQSKKETADKAALPQRISSYVRCASVEDVQRALVELKSPVLIAIAVTRTFENLKTRILPMEPKEHFQPGHAEYTGGHGMAVRGYTTIDDKVYYITRNSWGEDSWGENGECLIPSDYPGIWEMWAVTDRHPVANKIVLEFGSKDLKLVTVDDDGAERIQVMPMDVEPLAANDRTYVPLRFVATALAKLLRIPLQVNPIYELDGRVKTVEIVLLSKRGE